jgi:RND superfamily putative drug exporter
VAGRSPEALRIASRTSGRTILVSGLTVMIAMAGLFLAGGGPFPGVALGTIAVVGIAVVGSLTVLPALLSWLGPKADAGRHVVARPVVWGGVAVIALLALAAPALGLRLGSPAVDAPKGAVVIRTMDAIERAFPQAPAPAEVVVTGTDVTGPKVAAAVDALRTRVVGGGAAGDPDGGLVRGPVTATVLGGGRALLVDVRLAGNGTDTTSVRALQTLRGHTLPATLGTVPGISYSVAGDAAGVSDDIHQMHDALPLVLTVVAVLAFVLLMAAFRSAAVSLVSILLNLLSVGSAYGLVTLIFQDGRLQGPLDYTSFGGIVWWEPLLMFVFLFGISMDYHVFILIRIRELWTRGVPAKEAVAGGIASSSGVVTSAALIMVAVFSIFVTMSLLELKILGLGMAAAVLIDATVVRGVLAPAALALLGDRAWRRKRV